MLPPNERFGPGGVLILEEALGKIQKNLENVVKVAETKVLPGTRGKLLAPLMEVQILVKAIQEVAERSGVGKKLGFVRTPRGIQPIDIPETKPEAETKTETPGPVL